MQYTSNYSLPATPLHKRKTDFILPQKKFKRTSFTVQPLNSIQKMEFKIAIHKLILNQWAGIIEKAYKIEDEPKKIKAILESKLIKRKYQQLLFTHQFHNSYDIPKLINKTFFHFMRDKIICPDSASYRGFRRGIGAGLFLEAVSRVEECCQSPLVLSFVKKVKPLLKTYALLASCRTSPDLSKYIFKLIKQLKITESVLLPNGKEGHATCLLVTRTKPEKYTFTYYNTGLGVGVWHNRWEDTNRFQTFDTIYDIPAEDALNLETWNEYSQSAYDATDIREMYAILHNKFGKNGIKAPKSTHEEEYEVKQHSGTCTIQSPMAFLRHQSMQFFRGTYMEKEAFYKLVKTELLTQFYKDHHTSIDSHLGLDLHLTRAKLMGEMHLIKIAQDKTRFANALTIFRSLGVPFVRKPSNTLFKRYAVLRKASSFASHLWFERKEVTASAEDQNTSVLSLALAKYHCRLKAVENTKIEIQLAYEQYDLKKLADFLMHLVCFPTFYEEGIQEITRYLLKVRRPSRLGFFLLDQFNKYRADSEYIVDRLEKELCEAKKADLARQMRAYWDSL